MGKKKPFETDPKAAELDGKIQVNGQDSASSMNTELKAPNGGNGSITEVDEPRSAVNTKKAAEVVTAGSGSSGIGGLRRGALTFSGGADRVQDDESATTKESRPYKSGDRAGRREDPITRKVDLLDAEVFENKLYQSKPLAETTEKQGYNGNYHNEHAITQRNSGGAPADPLFERSVDTIECDMLYYPFGQYNIAKGSKNLSIHNWNASLNNGNGGYDSPTSFTVGNFLTRKLTVKITNNSGNYQITDFVFDKTDLTLDAIDEATYRLAGDAYIRNRNTRELDRNIMISKAGNESDPGWSCMGDAIVDATDQNQIQAYLDGVAGAFNVLSSRKLAEALAFQVNKAAKDGSRITGPMAEMVNGLVPIHGYGADGAVDEANGRGYAFSAAAYVKGGAGLWLATNDSLPKYTTKGKMLTLSLSFKSAYATAISNMDPFVVPELLLKELQHNELFSTIDGPYDPLKPVVMTNAAGLVTPIAIDTGCTFDTTTNTFENVLYTMHFENYRNKYNVKIKNFFVGGIFRWFNERAERLYKACESQAVSNVVTIDIPVASTATGISLWDLIVCSSIPYMVEERLTAFTEILKYEKNFGYPYSGLIHIKDSDINACDNYSFNGIETALTCSIAKPIAAMKVLMPEVFWPVTKVNGEALLTGHNGVAAYTVLPHYFVQNQFSYDKDNDTTTPRKLVLSDNYATIAYPTVRSGNMFSYFDTIYSMTEEDYRLSLDRMVVYPGYQNSYTSVSKIARAASAAGAIPMKAKAYKYGMTADGQPVIPYFAYANSAANKNETLTVGDIIATPRELGLFQVAPAGVLTPIMGTSNSLGTVATDSSYLGLSGPGFRARVYHGIGNNMGSTILASGSVNIDANASFRYNWMIVEATPYSSGTDIGMKFRSVATSSALAPFTTGSFDASGAGAYDPSTGTYADSETHDQTVTTYSNFKYLWARLQRLPFAICPFDCNGADLTSATGTAAMINNHDIYEFLYMFGLAGFRASDYSELIYQRTKEKISKGMNYTNDPFVDKSFLLK